MTLKERAREFRAKKSFGQNFLISKEHIERIVSSLSQSEPEAHKNEKKKNIIEIGPGLGFLTDELIKAGYFVNAIDLDEDALKRIAPSVNLNKIHADALNFDFKSLIESVNSSVSIVGNLPFNVGTKILLKIIGELDEPEWAVSNVGEMVLMFQKEVAERLVARPGDKAYNHLSILINAKAHTEFLFTVRAECFSPVPKVDAAVIRIIPRQDSMLLSMGENKRKNLKKIIRQAFQAKRKMLRNSLHDLWAKLPPERRTEKHWTKRPEELSLVEFFELAESAE